MSIGSRILNSSGWTGKKSSSDRSCVIVAAAYIDELLGYIFKLFLSSPSREKEDKERFSGYGPVLIILWEYLICLQA